ncbi:hypothetical protein MHYP_G00179940 [Metynnis hypsauchen]
MEGKRRKRSKPENAKILLRVSKETPTITVVGSAGPSAALHNNRGCERSGLNHCLRGGGCCGAREGKMHPSLSSSLYVPSHITGHATLPLSLPYFHPVTTFCFSGQHDLISCKENRGCAEVTATMLGTCSHVKWGQRSACSQCLHSELKSP